MNYKLKIFLDGLWKSILFWSFAMASFTFFRFYGLDQDNSITINEGFKNDTIFKPLLILTLLGLGLGVIYAFVDFFFEKLISKKISLGLNILIKSFFYFVATIFMVSIVVSLSSSVVNLNLEIRIGWWLTEKRFWALIYYIVLASFVFSFIKLASERFGKGLFFKILMGRYKKPKEEKRIFMFLDLKNSTSIAERLGHQLYSQFIQDCFFDLNKVVLKYAAEIYQYVGDEAVLSWPYKMGLIHNNCIRIFFAFQQQTQIRKEYYLKNYNEFPEFKAGLHGGDLMVAEVGFIKKEIAYHGDVINTSARIQAECNNFNATLLISESLLKDLNINKSSKSKSLGKVLLKGKHKEIEIHSLEMVHQ
jgi:adenylate cyclase